MREVISDAVQRGAPLRVVGAGTWLDAGYPVRASDALHVADLSGVVEYVPGDLTLTARAGTPLAVLADVTRAERQWLALDPFGDERGTLGATVATASVGPSAHAFGLVRDNVLGVEFVAGTGQIVRAGGRVVKNVAGFDLARLIVGSWGTLGALTEITVRLRPLHDVDRTIAVRWSADHARFTDTLRRLHASRVAPWALELLNGALAQRVGLGTDATLLARLAGNEEAVLAQRTAFAHFGDVSEAPADIWRTLRASEPARAVVSRFSWPLSRFPEGCRDLFAQSARRPTWLIHASPGRGVARCVTEFPEGLSQDGTDAHAAAELPLGDGVRIDERVPAWLRQPRDARRVDPVLARLMRSVKRAYDPRGVLNPGILGEEIG